VPLSSSAWICGSTGIPEPIYWAALAI